MLRGIDISNHQGDNGIELSNVLPYYDFCIVKATGGTHFVDSYCNGFVDKCIEANKLWGFYHFANDGIYSDGVSEAYFFVNNCRNYFGKGIPVLDWEVDVGVEWVNSFVETVYNLTGVWCWVYGNPWRFNQGIVNENCARWIAAYPSWILNPQPDFDPGECPECNGLVAAWQYASDGVVPTYSGNLDVNVFYGDVEAWNKYANPNNSQQSNIQNTPQNENKKWTFDTEKFTVEIQEKI